LDFFRHGFSLLATYQRSVCRFKARRRLLCNDGRALLASSAMRLLCFQAKRFRWKTHSKTLADVPERDVEEAVEEAVIVFLHAEMSDADAERRASVLRQALKHLKWLANKRGLKNIVLHSFAHLGGDSAPAGFTEAFIGEIAGRLRDTGYAVSLTPFGYFCEWDLSVYGDSLAKVWKEI
jgi:hypothetical protein